MALMNRPRLQMLELRPSLRLTLLLGSAHLSVLLVMVMLPIAPWLQLSGAVLLLLSLGWTVFHHALRRGADAVTALAFVDRARLRVRTAAGTWLEGQVLGTSTIGATLAVLNIKLDDRKRSIHVVILGDSMHADDFRRLRVWLRWGPKPVIEDAVAF